MDTSIDEKWMLSLSVPQIVIAKITPPRVKGKIANLTSHYDIAFPGCSNALFKIPSFKKEKCVVARQFLIVVES